MNGVTSDTRNSRRRRCRSGAMWRAVVVWVFLTAVWSPFDAGLRAEESVLSQGRLKIRSVEIEGHRTIPESAIARKIKIRPGQMVSQQRILDEVAALHKTSWFFDVTPITRQAEDGNGYVLIFRVRERPVLRRVTYKGNDEIKTKQLEAITNLKAGGAYDVSLNRDSVRAIKQYYFDKGYIHCNVTLEKGNSEKDREVIFAIDEGPKVVVTDIKFKFKDTKFIPAGRLKMKLKTSTRKLWFFGGKFDPASIADDIAALKDFYFSYGFFDVQIEEKVQETKDRSKVRITYVVDEGIRYKVGKIRFNGPRVISEKSFRDRLKLREGDYFDDGKLSTDISMIKGDYGKLGRIFAVVNTGSKYYEEPGVMDLVYDINEDKPYRIRKIIVKINGDYPTTKEKTVLNRILVKPGDLADPALIQKSKRRLEGAQIYAAGAGQPGKPPTVAIKQVSNQQTREAATEIIRAQALDQPANNPIINNSPQGDPFGRSLSLPPADWYEEDVIDLEVGVTEAQTGRLMIGAGINSDTGLVGSIVLDERNFDILRPPTSWDDIWTGRAWRGNGEQFRLEAVPGSEVNRYLINWRNPYFMDQDFSVGVSGFYFDRIYEDWDEQRLGGRVTIGRQFTREWSGAIAFRLEEVKLFDPAIPTPPELMESLGDSFLSTVRASIAHDTRDAAFLPSEGHYIELAYEQAYGEFTYPRFEAEASQFFQVGARPDGSGRQIITLRGELGFTGSDTPIFEKFYAGGYQSFRGFRFRGVSPRDLNVTIGGEFLALGTVEYMHPLLANDSVQAVVFSDFGTVEENVSFNDFRVTVGAGLRITIPAMGPVPLALDWAIPLADQPRDERQLFQFYFGVFN